MSGTGVKDQILVETEDRDKYIYVPYGFVYIHHYIPTCLFGFFSSIVCQRGVGISLDSNVLALSFRALVRVLHLKS